MTLPDTLRPLLTAPGPSGYEGPAAQAFREAVEPWADEVTTDTLGSTVARVKGTGGGPTVAVMGHIDEIGIIVSHVEDGGYLRFQTIGGWDPVILVGQRVVIASDAGPVAGVIGKKAIHLLEEEERKQAPKIKHLHVDIGAKDGDEAKTLVRIGDSGVIASEPLELPNRRVVSRSMDNRLGCWIALEAARLVKEAGKAAGDVCAVAAVQEEITFGGSATTVFSLRPDVAIVTDVTHATDTPGVELGELPPQPFGCGAVIARGSTLHPVVTQGLIDAAEAEGIPYVVEATSRHTGTDADATHASRKGVPSAVVSVPLRYMHSPVEMVQLDDLEACARVIAAFCGRLDPATSFLR